MPQPAIAVMPNQAVITPMPQQQEHDSNRERYPVMQSGQLDIVQSMQIMPPVVIIFDSPP